jgi:hypothetical protein
MIEKASQLRVKLSMNPMAAALVYRAVSPSQFPGKFANWINTQFTAYIQWLALYNGEESAIKKAMDAQGFDASARRRIIKPSKAALNEIETFMNAIVEQKELYQADMADSPHCLEEMMVFAYANHIYYCYQAIHIMRTFDWPKAVDNHLVALEFFAKGFSETLQSYNMQGVIQYLDEVQK